MLSVATIESGHVSPRQSRAVFEKVAQIPHTSAMGKLLMHETFDSLIFFGCLREKIG
jgi:hypothetical protein